MPVVTDQESKTRDAKSSEEGRVRAGTSEIRLAGGMLGIENEWKGR